MAVVVLFFLGMAISIGPAVFAIVKRSVVWYVLSIVVPCLYSLLAVYALDAIYGRPLDVREIIVGAIFFLGLGWSNAWLSQRKS